MTIETIEARKDLLRVGEPHLHFSSGRMRIHVNGKRRIYSHYVWFLNTGHWPVRGEVIHHIDDDPTNDEFSNLALMTLSEHSRLHHIGRPLSKEIRAKLSVAMTGKTLSKETKAKISAAMTGKNNPMYGRTGENSGNWKGDDAGAVAKYRRHYRYPNKYLPLTEEEKEEFNAYYRKRYRRLYGKKRENSIVK